jgi:ADP-ribose pyrophosphatase YjhB (NUDIX family)
LNKQWIAAWLRRVPWAGYAAQAVYRRWQPWMTAGVVGVVMNAQEQVLLVEHVFHPKFSWGLPGGWMGNHETPSDTVRRELHEETSLTITVIKPLIITQTEHFKNHLDIAYLCFAANTEAVHLSSELLAYRWYERAALAEIPLVRFHRQAIAAAQTEVAAGALKGVS